MPVFPQFERLLWFHEEAKNNRYPNSTRLAAQFEVSAKTAQRDIDCLRDRFRAPLEYDPTRRGFYYIDDLFEMPCLPASQQEVLCLLLARRLLEGAAGGFISRELHALKEKIFTGAQRIGLTPQATEQGFSAVWSEFSPAGEDTFRLVAWSIIRRHPVCFDYRSPQSGVTTHRTVEPHHLLHYMASWVLIAWCRDRRDWRRFYLSRMNSPQVLDQVFSLRPESQWRPLLQTAFGLFQGDKTFSITLRFSPFRSRWIREQHWHPRQEITEHPDGGLTLTLPAADFREIKMKILQFGADCEVLAPRSLRREIQTDIAKMAGIYKKQGKTKK